MIFINNNNFDDYIIESKICNEGVYYYRIPYNVIVTSFNVPYKAGDMIYVAEHKYGNGFYISNINNFENVDIDSIRKLVISQPVINFGEF